MFQLNYVDMQVTYVDMQHDYAMHMTCNRNKIHVNIIVLACLQSNSRVLQVDLNYFVRHGNKIRNNFASLLI